jgi:hypothetical protein
VAHDDGVPAPEPDSMTCFAGVGGALARAKLTAEVSSSHTHMGASTPLSNDNDDDDEFKAVMGRPASRYRSGSPFLRRWTRPVCTTPDATGVLAGVGQLRGRAMAPQGVELSAKEADHVRERESGDKEGAVEHDGGCAQTRACHHRFARLASPRAPGGDQGSPCRGRCSR